MYVINDVYLKAPRSWCPGCVPYFRCRHFLGHCPPCALSPEPLNSAALLQATLLLFNGSTGICNHITNIL